MKQSTKVFILEALRSFKKIGSVLPSSKYLAERMTKPIPSEFNGTIVELGVGTGVFTKAILGRAGKKCKVVAFESNGKLVQLMKKTVTDPRITFIHDKAQTAAEHLHKLGIPKADYVISGLPLSSMKKTDREDILKTIHRILHADGTYVQFQYFFYSLPHIKKHFKNVKVVYYETRNFPPAFIFECKKA
ncbi:MAG: methyltransferase domain-containing protein [Candidatus Sungbacteria bacterium]|nr:methyltransferase domain-containing protein [Candidatus Sungbacteria bacterium]